MIGTIIGVLALTAFVGFFVTAFVMAIYQKVLELKLLRKLADSDVDLKQILATLKR